ncbi:MAG TPA: signal recognition particle-docking protein FtsY [Anaerolineales bacterium]|nr:signal recognition particle-docking protein FtsY [Anaerolineales bacterium]
MLNAWKSGLGRTRKSTFGRIASLLGATEINSETWEDLEALLIQADLGVETTDQVVEALRRRTRAEGLTKAYELRDALESELRARLLDPPEIDLSADPSVVILVGVNGSGKTTSAAKLGKRFQDQGRRVLLVAADTYRAGAIDQLQVWADRLRIPILLGQPDGDPGAVTYDAIQSALARHYDLLLVDTAGRLHTRFNLMEELKKICRVASKALQGAPHAVWLVMDATTGQNSMQQARAFTEAVKTSGVILAKLDSSARGGMAFAIANELGLPILFAGLGEGADDLKAFDPDAFVDGIMADFGLDGNKD